MERAPFMLRKRYTCIIALCILIVFSRVADAAVTLAQPNTTSLSSGLAGYWPLDGELTNWRTGTTQDFSGNGNTGQLIGMSTSSSLVTGRVGQAFKFPGSNSTYVDVPSITSSTYTSNFTVSVWVNYASPSTYQTVLGTRNGNTSGWQLEVMNGGLVSWRTLNGSQQSIISTGASGTIRTGLWMHIVVVHGNGVATIYVNGVKNNGDQALANPAASASQAFRLGYIGAGSGGSSWLGGLDEARIYNRTLSAQEIALLYAAGKANVGASNAVALNSGLILYWPMDGSTTRWTTNTTLDISGNSNMGSFVGMSTTSSPTTGKIGQALKITGNGTSQKIISANVPAITGTASRTMAAWVRVSSCTDPGGLLGMGAVSNAQFYLTCSLANTFNFALWSNSSASINSGIASRDNAWHHLVATYDGTNTRLYVDGVLKGSGTSLTGTGSTQVFINQEQVLNSGATGAIDDVRLYNRALTRQEVEELYRLGTVNVAHTPTASSGQNVQSSRLVGHWTFDGPYMNWRTNTAADSSGNANNGTLINLGTTTAPAAGKIGQALKFNGSSSYVSIPAATSLNASSDVTVTGWVYLTAKTAGALGNTVFAKRGGSTNYQFWIRGDGSSPVPNQPVLASWNGSTNVYGTATLSLNTWYHVAMVHTSTTVTFYINGVSDGTQSQAIGGTLSSAAYIGWDTATVFFAGSMDDVRVYDRALSSQEMYQLYRLGR